MAEVLNVTVRKETGSGRIRRLRKTGQVPAILYGHGEANVNLQLSARELMLAIKHGGKLVSLKGEVTDSALIRSVQWDVWGKDVLHLDLMRVSATERVTTTVAIELRGTAVGTTEGGVIQFVIHEVEIECPALSIPEKITINITDLHLGKAIHAGELPLPEGANITGHGELVVVQCIAPHDEEAGVPGAEGGGVEPEIIGKKEKEEADEKK
jgi:large subunit ribosomal protein L25